MTTTLDPTSIFEEGETDPTPGTMRWVSTGVSAPINWRHKPHVLAVYTSRNRWLLLLPNQGGGNSADDGWRLTAHLTEQEMSEHDLHRFEQTHRGWWPTSSSITFVEEATPCDTCHDFHGAGECEGDLPTRIAKLERDLAESRANTVRAVKEHEDFVAKASEVLAEAANSHDLCGVYDQVAVQAGLLPRSQDYDIEIEVTYRQTVTVRAHNEEEAADWVHDRSVIGLWTPPAIFHPAENVSFGSTYSLSFDLAD